jgi:hypothetical protein
VFDGANTVIERLRQPLLILILLAAGSMPARAQSGAGTIEDLVKQVSLDSLTAYVEVLSGMTPVMVSDSVLTYYREAGSQETETLWLIDTLVTLTNRRYLSNDVATYYLEKKLRSFGLDTVVNIPGMEDPWLQNIVAAKWGTEHPNKHYILCAHYDGVLRGPGADDNASGTAAVLEAARILAGVEPTATIIFALWDSEEIGLIGSAEYAADARESTPQIAAVINLDMIGWDGDDDHVLEVHSNDASTFIANDVKRTISEQNLDLSPIVINPGTGRSDHASFWNNGFPAVLLIEEFIAGDFNPRYHTAGDSLQYFNLGYFLEMAKLGLATIAGYTLNFPAVSNEPDFPEAASPSLARNYPNPFSGSTQIPFTLSHSGYASIRIFDLLGREIDEVSLGMLGAGSHSATWSAPENAPVGVLVYTLETDFDRKTGMMTLAR